MTFTRRPRVFLSYRHEEPHRWFGRSLYNFRHRAWVNMFARSLASWNVDVIWDDRLRRMFKDRTRTDPARLPFLAEVSTLCLQVAQTFMPILTRGYVERIASADGGGGYGTVSEEWRNGVAEHAARRAEIVTIVREWPIDGSPVPPPPISSRQAWDFRFVAPTRDEVELLCDSLHGVWEVERPHFDMPFGDVIRSYTDYCTKVLRLPPDDLESWGCDFDRPRRFIEEASRLMDQLPPDRLTGSQRDMEEASKALGIRTVRTNASDTPRTPPDAEQDKQADEAARKLFQSVMAAHESQVRKPFDFGNLAPGGRASSGLYFGRTLPGYSYLP